MAKSANLYARIEPEIKESAESILNTLGISVSSAINMFYKQIILQRGLPFSVKIPKDEPLNINNLTSEQLNSELQKGYEDLKSGKVKKSDEVFASIYKDYNL